MKSKLKLPRGFFRSEKTYFDAFYKINKEILDENVFGEYGANISARETIKRKAEEEGVTWNEAIKSWGRSEQFIDVKTRLVNNAYEKIKSDRNTYLEFREITKEHGKFTKINLNDFVYVGENTYMYHGVMVSFKNSPDEVIIEKVGI